MFTNSPNVAHYTGFAPFEISALVNLDTVREHLSEAAFLWQRREAATVAPHFTLDQLRKLDARLIGHLAGLSQPGVLASGLVEQALGRADAGTMFAAAHAVFFAADIDRMRSLLKVALTDPQLTEALTHGIAWLTPERSAAALQRLRASPIPAHQRISLSVATLRRDAEAEQEVRQGAAAADAPTRAIALRALGELGLRQCLGLARDHLNDPDGSCRFWTACSTALLGDPAGAVAAWEIGLCRPELQRQAIAIAMRCGPADWARAAIRALAKNPASLRVSIQATGALGDPTVIPWLLDRMDDRASARVAGEALACITCVDIERLDLDRDPPDDAEAHDEAHPEDSELRWPDPERVRAWWSTQADRFSAGTRYLVGQPTSDPNAMGDVLRRGTQRQRQAAAIERARLQPGAALFPVHQRADWQRRRFNK